MYSNRLTVKPHQEFVRESASYDCLAVVEECFTLDLLYHPKGYLYSLVRRLLDFFREYTVHEQITSVKEIGFSW